MYTQQNINHAHQANRAHQYHFALNAWNQMTLKSRQDLLVKHGHNKVYANRTFAYLFKNIRQDLTLDLNGVKA